MRFYLDEQLSSTIAEIARHRGIDAISSHECGRDGLADEEQLRQAAAEGRCLVSQNHVHLVPLSMRFLENGWPHSGVLLVPRSLPGNRFAAIAEALARYDREHLEGVPAYTVDFLRPPETPD